MGDKTAEQLGIARKEVWVYQVWTDSKYEPTWTVHLKGYNADGIMVAEHKTFAIEDYEIARDFARGFVVR